MLEIATFFCALIADVSDDPDLNLSQIESIFFPSEKKTESESEPVSKNKKEIALVDDTEESNQNRFNRLQQKIDAIYIETIHDCPTALTTPSRPQICGNDLFVYADALYWRVFEGGTDYAITDVRQFGTEFTLEVVEPSRPRRANFHWSWGYRVGAAYYLPHDEWDLNLSWTRYSTKARDHFEEEATATAGNLFGPAIANVFAQITDLSWKIKYTTIDLEMGRGFFLNPNFTIRPFAGVKAAWISQNAHIVYIQSTPLIPANLAITAPIDLNNNFSGVGPEAGLDLQFFFNGHWSLFNQFSAALLYGKFEVNLDMDVLTEPSNFKLFKLGANTHRISPMTQACLGIGWETDFHENQLYLSLHFGYELQVWWRQNQQLSFDTFQKWVRFAEHLTIHGLTVDARIDF